MAFYDIKENEIEVIKGTAANFREREGARHSLRYVLGDLGDIKDKYFILGFHLNEFVKNEYYKDFGYGSMKDFCLANIPIEYSSLSRCMTVHKYTCEKLNAGYPDLLTNRMQEKYKKYGYSQLVEMVGLNEEEEKLFTPDMTVKEMRELKNQIKEVKKSFHFFPRDYKISADTLKTSILENNKTNSCDVAILEKDKTDNCDVAIIEKENSSVDEVTTELSKKDDCKDMLSYSTFLNYPSNFLSEIFHRYLGTYLISSEPKGKMLQMEIPDYNVTIRISFSPK